MHSIESLRQNLHALRDSTDQQLLKSTLPDTLRAIPARPEYVDLFRDALDAILKITDPLAHRDTLLAFVRELPHTGLFKPVYISAMEAVITAGDGIAEEQHRVSEFIRIATELPKADDFIPLRVHAWRLALSLPDKPRDLKPSLESIARGLPRESDFVFYRRLTLLGVARIMPKEGVFREIFKDAIRLAIDAVGVIAEPYYRKYTLLFIVNELKEAGDFPDLHRLAVTEAYKAAIAITEPFAREYALAEVLKEVPKTPEYSELVMALVEQSLEFFTMKKWLEDVEATDVIDFMLSAEEPGVKESRKRRFARAKYANTLAAELDKFGEHLNDIRFIEILKPYTHIWVQPKKLRDAARKIISHLESLRETYHGREFERPVFLREIHPDTGSSSRNSTGATFDCIAIDIGATNTVIMRKRDGEPPDFVILPGISKQLGRIHVVPTLLSRETNSIGAEVSDDHPAGNVKQMFLERQPNGKALMERFIATLCRHLLKGTGAGGWFSRSARNIADIVYISAPVGFQSYKNAIREIAGKALRGVEIQIIEEPLAAAIGYQVVEDRDKVILIIDFGGSTLNTMIARVNAKEVHVVAKPERAQMLGGQDIDNWLAEHLAALVGIPADNIPFTLRRQAEEIKIELSRKGTTPFLWEGRYIRDVTREQFEGILDRHLFYKIVDRTMSNVLKKAEVVGLRKEKLEAVLITGGTSQIPSFKEKIGSLFPELRRRNLIYDHEPLSAVAIGAAQYGTKEVTDRHLGMAYAVRHTTDDAENPYSYSIILEKGEHLPIKKSFSIKPACRLCVQKGIDIQLFEVPESLIARRWVAEAGIEFIKQELQQTRDIALAGLKTLTLPIDENMRADVELTFNVDESGLLSLQIDQQAEVETGLRLR